MSYKLRIGSIVKDRYVIKDIISSAEIASVYLAYDKKVTAKLWILKEFTFAEELSEEDIKKRREKIAEAVEALRIYEHKNLANILDYFVFHQKDYIVMEYLEGRTLEELSQKTLEYFPEEQIVKWACQICDGLEYLNNRPVPYVFGILDPSRIIVENNGNVRLLNYGLSRLFGIIEPVIFSKDTVYFSKELNSFASLLIFLTTKQKTTDISVLENYSISDQMKKDIAQFSNPKAFMVYSSFIDIKIILENLIPKPFVPDTATVKAKREFKKISEKIKIKLDNLLFTVSEQKPLYIVFEAAGIIFLAVFLYITLNPSYNYTKKSETVYVLCGGKEIVCIDAQTKKIIDKIKLDLPVNFIKSDVLKEKLYLSVSNNTHINEIRQINCLDNKPDPDIKIKVDIDPQNILINYKKNLLYVLNRKSNNISVVDLGENKMTGILPTGKRPSDIKESPGRPFLYVANSASDTISIYDTEKKEQVDLIPASGMPYFLLPVREEKKNMLFAVCRKSNDVNIYQIHYDYQKNMSHKMLAYLNTEGVKPSSIYLDKEGAFLYAANSASNDVSVMDLADKKIKTKIYVGKTPVDMLFIKPNYLWVVNNEGGNIAIIDTFAHKVMENIYVGKNPTCITYVP
ncbi:MAG: protein kinase [Armatimonadota bacterium]